MTHATLEPLGPPPTRGAWSVSGSALMTARMAGGGFDWVAVDAQHGAFGRQTLTQTLALTANTGAPVFVRVSRNDAAEIGFAVDAGARGVIVPMVDSAEAARAAVRAIRYPPHGQRSFGPVAPLWGGDTTPHPRLWVMIETSRAVSSVSEIATVEGVDGLFIGPFDLALALGVDVDVLLADQSARSPLTRIVAAGREAGRELGAFAGDAARMRVLAARGFDHVAAATDASMLDIGARSVLGTDSAASRDVSPY